MASYNLPPPNEDLAEQEPSEALVRSLAERDPTRAPFRNVPEVAAQIITTARFHGVPLRNDAGLVSVLAGTEIDQNVPKELHSAIAEVISWIQRVDNAARRGQKA